MLVTGQYAFLSGTAFGAYVPLLPVSRLYPDKCLSIYGFIRPIRVIRGQLNPGNLLTQIKRAVGYRETEFLGHPELQSVVASGMIQIKVIIPYPGAPLPDLFFIDHILSLSGLYNRSGPLRAAFGVKESGAGSCR